MIGRHRVAKRLLILCFASIATLIIFHYNHDFTGLTYKALRIPTLEIESEYHGESTTFSAHEVYSGDLSDIQIDSKNGIKILNKTLMPGQPAHVRYVRHTEETRVAELMKKEEAVCMKNDSCAGSCCPCIPPALSKDTIFISKTYFLFQDINNLFYSSRLPRRQNGDRSKLSRDLFMGRRVNYRPGRQAWCWGNMASRELHSEVENSYHCSLQTAGDTAPSFPSSHTPYSSETTTRLQNYCGRTGESTMSNF